MECSGLLSASSLEKMNQLLQAIPSGTPGENLASLGDPGSPIGGHSGHLQGQSSIQGHHILLGRRPGSLENLGEDGGIFLPDPPL
jgi:hypothetical protein